MLNSMALHLTNESQNQINQIMTNYKHELIEGIGVAIGKKLTGAGIKGTQELLQQSKTAAQRKELAKTTGLDEKQILKFANMADLLRIKGIGKQFSELLEAAGVDTVPELAQRKADNLTTKMEETNAAKKLCRRTPSLKEVTRWVEDAKKLPRILEY
jgi:predicted flap endonuclease-1-like 5' DNA nuclease